MDDQPINIRVNWQRLPLAVLGLAAVIAVPVTLVLGIVNVISFAWFFGMLIFAASCIGGLRYLAISSRHKPYGYQTRETTAPVQLKQVPGLTPKQQDSAPFDAHETTDAAEPTAQEHTESGVAEAVSEAKTALESSAAKKPVTKTAATQWEPVEVPEPSYLRGAKVEREEPEPLELPEAPQPTINRLKETLPEPKITEEDLEIQQRLVHKSVRPNQAKAGALNLDDVLDRRRA